LARITILTLTTKQIQRGEIGFNTIIIGNGTKALKIFNDLITERVSTGHKIIGYCTINGSKTEFKNELNALGPAENIASLVDQYRIEEIIIAPEKEELESIEKIISLIHDKNVMIKADPDLKDLLTGSVRLSAIFATPLIEISPMVMPVWQMEIKRIIDILASILGILFFSPLLFITAIIIKSNSPGPIFYAQERIGKWGKPFKILKFRTMFTDAEKFGPALSSKEDPRITSVGKVLRKYRIDELPQLINVLRGEMSLVGPRPERAFFIEQIVIHAPHYKLLHRVKPGITSWGMVNYGYAENVEQMIQRLRYDILYLDNMSLVLDFKILIYTILTVIKGRGM
jgi:exopolysaccharide biosynthesis polyprenyl glycosylphosphotransferase